MHGYLSVLSISDVIARARELIVSSVLSFHLILLLLSLFVLPTDTFISIRTDPLAYSNVYLFNRFPNSNK